LKKSGKTPLEKAEFRVLFVRRLVQAKEPFAQHDLIMKTQACFLTAIFTAWLASAQTPPPGTISRAPSSTTESTNQLGLGSLTITNRSGQTYSGDQIQSQLRDLHRAVEQTAPALTAITETYSNSVAGAQPSVAGGIAGVLGGILNRNTNAAGTSGQASSGKTNLLGGILQGVLAANAATNSASASANPSTVRDLVALQEHLQAITPILQRLDVSTNTLTPTGR
jgi:hypothetical protein